MAAIDLCFDIDAFDTAIQQYAEAKDKFCTVKQTLTDCIDSLREGWQSAAGDEFFKDFDDNLSPSLDQYINFVAYLSESLVAAKAQYEQIQQKANTLPY